MQSPRGKQRGLLVLAAVMVCVGIAAALTAQERREDAPPVAAPQRSGPVPPPLSQLDEALIDAVQKGNFISVRGMLDEGANSNARPPSASPVMLGAPGASPGPTLLTLAAMRGRRDIFDLLIERGADIHFTDKVNRTALCWAVYISHRDGVKKLVQNGAPVNARLPDGTNALWWAVEKEVTNKSFPMTTFLLAHGAEVNVSGTMGMTPLMYTAQFGNTALCKVLLAKGADVNAVDSRGDTAMMWATEHGHAEVARLIRQRGPKVSIFQAVAIRDVETVRAYLDKGTDVNARDAGGDTLLFGAVFSGSADAVKLLLDRGADPKGSEGRAPLGAAAAYGYTEIARMLLDKGADIDVQIPSGTAGGGSYTPLIYAAKEGHADMVKLLLSRGVDLKAADNQGARALVRGITARATLPPPPHLAKSSPAPSVNPERIPGLLMDAGVDVNAQGGAALITAASREDPILVKRLLEKGADPNARGEHGATALMRAVESECVPIVRLLLGKGADLHARDEDGSTALQLAIRGNQPAVARILRQAGAKE